MSVSSPFRLAQLAPHIRHQLGLTSEFDVVDYYDVHAEEWVRLGVDGICEFGVTRRIVYRRPGVKFKSAELQAEISRLKQRSIPSNLLFKRTTPSRPPKPVQQSLTASSSSIRSMSRKRQREVSETPSSSDHESSPERPSKQQKIINVSLSQGRRVSKLKLILELESGLCRSFD